MSKIKVILVDKTPVEIFLLVVIIIIPLIRQNLVLQVLFHDTIGCVDIRLDP
jgi:hypothetical protein